MDFTKISVDLSLFIAHTIIVTQHEKIELMCTKYTPSHYSTYLTFSIRYTSYVKCINFPSVCCTSNKKFTDKLCLSIKL